MDALLMCGGRGTRLGGGTEKPLRQIGGRPMVDRVVDALADSRIETVYVVVSPHTPRTRSRLEGRRNEPETPDLAVVDAPGDGYVSDLQYAVEAVEAIDPPVLTVAADLPLLDGDAIDAVLDAARVPTGGEPVDGDGDADGENDGDGDGDVRIGSLTVCVPAERKRELGVSADTASEVGGREVVPAGINVVGGTEGEDEGRDESRGGSGDGDGGGDGDSDEEGGGDGDSDEEGGGDGDGDDIDDADDDTVRLTEDVRIAVNVNYPSDVRIAERLIADADGDGDGSEDPGDADEPGATDGGSDRREPDASDPDHSEGDR